MLRKFHLPIIIGVSIALLALMMVVGTFALAQTGTSQGGIAGGEPANPEGGSIVPGGPGFVSLSAAAFTPYEADYEVYFYGTNIYNPNPAFDAKYVAPISLPNGATITKFVAFYVDNSTGGDISATLKEAPFNSDVGNWIATVSSSGNYPVYRSSSVEPINTPVIDQQQYSYYIEVVLPPSPNIDVKFSGVRVDYSYPSMLPLIKK
jgi:hypothetical protein